MKQFILNGVKRLVGLCLDDQHATFTSYDTLYDRRTGFVNEIVPISDIKITTKKYLSWVRPIFAKKATLEIYDNMTRIRVSGAQPDHLENKKRGQVGIDFSGKKRKRFVDEINKWRLKPNANMFMLTLTYPDEFPLNWRVWKEDLEKFRERLITRFPDIEGFWRLELIDRKSGVSRGLIAPHYHLVLSMFTRISVASFRRWCRQTWSKIAHMNDKYHGEHSVRVDRILTPRHALNYAAKYCTKYSDAPITKEGEIMNQSHIEGTVGRQWGKIGEPDCSISEIYVVSRGVSSVLFDLCCEMKFQAGDAWKGLFKQDGNGSYTVYGIGDNPKPHERYNRPSLIPAREMMRRAILRAGSGASVRKEAIDWNMPLTDKDYEWSWVSEADLLETIVISDTTTPS